MKVLVACEESQVVCTAFREKGHEAYSCDLVDPSGGHPEWHVKGDCIALLNGAKFQTMDGVEHEVKRWDLIIAHPPCDHLAVSGAKWFEGKRNDGRQREAIEFFCQFFNADCDRVAIENPVNIISGNYVREWFPEIAEKYDLPRKPDQIIHPYFFGDPFEKKTCLWLKGLHKLKATEMVEPPARQVCKSGKTLPTWYSNAKHADRKRIRAKTFPGFAAAMADQWTKGDLE